MAEREDLTWTSYNPDHAEEICALCCVDCERRIRQRRDPRAVAGLGEDIQSAEDAVGRSGFSRELHEPLRSRHSARAARTVCGQDAERRHTRRTASVQEEDS